MFASPQPGLQAGWYAAPMRTLRLLFVALIVAAGCDTLGGDPESPESRLQGREFLLDSSEGFTPVAGTTVRLRFNEDTEFSMGAGCNSMFGSYEIRGGLLVSEGVGSTEIGCEQTLHEQDEWLATFMTSSPGISLDGDTLTLTGEDATLVFLDREVADPDRPLTGRGWTVDSFIQGDGISNLALDEAPTLQFRDDGVVEVFTGCVMGGGTFSAAADTLTLNTTFAEADCTDGAAIADQLVRAALSTGESTFEIDASRLTIMRGGDGIAATTD